MTMKIEAPIRSFLGRKYVTVQLPVTDANKLFKPETFSSETGQGEQRFVNYPHQKKITAAMQDGRFTPTGWTASITEEQRARMKVENGRFTLELADDTIPLIDAGHRQASLASLLENDEFKPSVETSWVDICVLLDGNRREDFLNLQFGRPVDKSHLQSLTVAEGLLDEKNGPALKLAYEAAKILSSDKESPFYNSIRFDTGGASGIPISSLMAKGASDISTSLVGGARVALEAGHDAKWLANTVQAAFNAVKAGAAELTRPRHRLCPPPNGNKGPATMIIGIGNLLAYRLTAHNREIPNDEDLKILIRSIRGTLAGEIAGNFSGPSKRTLMGEIATVLYDDVLDDDNHEGVPLKLVTMWGTSTFGVKKLDKPRKKRGRKPAAKVEADVPIIVDDEVVGELVEA